MLGPMAGPYVLILLASVAGAMWPLTAARTMGKAAGAWLLLRCAATALVLTGVLAGILERSWGLPISEGLAAESASFGEIFASSDAREGTRAFVAKEQPSFKGA